MPTPLQELAGQLSSSSDSYAPPAPNPLTTPKPHIPNPDNYVHDKEPGSGPVGFVKDVAYGATHPGQDVTSEYDAERYHKAANDYLRARQARFEAILQSLPADQRDYQKYQLQSAMDAVMSADGYQDLSKHDRVAKRAAVYDQFENTAAPTVFAAADPASTSTDPRTVYTPQEIAAIQGQIGKYMAPYAAQAAQDGQIAAGIYGELAGSVHSPALATLARAQGAQAQAGGSALAAAYAAQAQAYPAVNALKQAQALTNQNAQLQQQLAYYQALQQGGGSSTDTSTLLQQLGQ